MTNLLLLNLLYTVSVVVGEISITSTSVSGEDTQGNCVLLLTCTTSPIQGNLFWYATLSNGSEVRFARNDGGNAEPNPPYNELKLEGVTNYYTEVSRGIINGDLFTEFNSTLAFDMLHLLLNNLSSVSCGSVTTNSSKITPPMPKFNEGDYELYEVRNSTGVTFECRGSGIPLNFMVGNCLLNTTNTILQWSINGTIVVQYDYIMGSLQKVLKYSEEYLINITNLQQQNNKLNILSRLQIIPDLYPGTSVSCGSNFIRSNTLRIFNELIFDTKCEVNVTAAYCFQSITCTSRNNGECEIHIGRNRTDAMSRNSIMGSVNSSINTKSLSLKWPGDYFYVARLIINQTCETEGNFSDLQGAAQLSDWNAAIIAVGVVLSVISISIMIIVILVALKYSGKLKKKVIKLKIIKLGIIIVSIIAAVINVVLWIATAAVVVSQEGHQMYFHSHAVLMKITV